MTAIQENPITVDQIQNTFEYCKNYAAGLGSKISNYVNDSVSEDQVANITSFGAGFAVTCLTGSPLLGGLVGGAVSSYQSSDKLNTALVVGASGGLYGAAAATLSVIEPVLVTTGALVIGKVGVEVAHNMEVIDGQELKEGNAFLSTATKVGACVLLAYSGIAGVGSALYSAAGGVATSFIYDQFR